MHNLNILVIANDSDYTDLINKNLNSEFNLTFEVDNQNNLKSHKGTLFHIIIIDICLMDKFKLSLFEQMKEEKNDIFPLIVMTSEEQSTDIIEKCFSLGAASFFHKKEGFTALKYKLNTVSVYINELINVKQRSAELESLITVTTHQANSYGWCLELISSISSCYDFDNLMNIIAQAFVEIEEHICIELRLPEKTYHLDSNTIKASPIVVEMFDLLRSKGRVYSFNQRTIFNDEHISILVKSMPHDESKSSIYVDSFAKLIPAIESRITNMLDKLQIIEMRSHLAEIVGQLEPTIKQVQQEKQLYLDKLILEMGLNFHTLGFNEKQEEYITDMLQGQLAKQGEIDVTVHDILALVEKIITD